MSYNRVIRFVLFPAAEWATSLLILNTDEFGLESDTGKIKKGNGLDYYSALSYMPGFGGGGSGGDMIKAVYDPTNISADAFDRANHTGTQLAATISDFIAAAISALTGQNVSIFLNDAGYLTSETDPVFTAWLAGPPDNTEFTNGAGYLTNESDPVFDAWLATHPNVSWFTNDAEYITGIGAFDTDDLPEGATNKYFTDERAQDAIGAMVDASLVYTDATPALSRAALTGAITAPQGSNATSLGSFTKAQLDAAVSDGDIMFKNDILTVTQIARTGFGTFAYS